MAQSVLVLITKAPYGYEDGFAGYRLALSQLAGGMITKCSVLLVADGALNAVASQKPDAVLMPSNIDPLNDIFDFDAKVYCVVEDLEERVGSVEIVKGITKVTWTEARKVITEHDLVTTF